MQKNSLQQTDRSTHFRKLLIVSICVILALFSVIPAAHAKHRHLKKEKYPRLCSYYYEQQNELGGISGRIMGNLLPVDGAIIVLMRNNKLIDRTITDEDGQFIFRYTDTGQYDITASKEGFITGIITRIPVTPNHITRNDLYLPKYHKEQMPGDVVSEPYSYNRKFMREH